MTKDFGDFDFSVPKLCLLALDQRQNHLILLDKLIGFLIHHDKTNTQRAQKANQKLNKRIFFRIYITKKSDQPINQWIFRSRCQRECSSGALVIPELETSSTVWEPVDSPFIPAAAVSLAKMLFSFLKQKLKLLV